MNRAESFAAGLMCGVLIAVAAINGVPRLFATDVPYVSDGSIVTTINGVRCVGHVVSPPGFVGTPPRLWICADGRPPWLDHTGVRFPYINEGEQR